MGATPVFRLTVSEVDGSPSVGGVRTIRVPNGTLTADGSGQVTMAFPGVAFAAMGTHLTVTAQATTDVPLAIRGAAGQSGDLVQWWDGTGTVLARVDSLGRGYFGGLAFGDFGFGNPEISRVGGPGPVNLRGLNPLTLDLGSFAWTDGVGTVVASVRSRQSPGEGQPGLVNTHFNPNAGANGDRHIVSRSHASQVNNVYELTDASGNVLLAFGPAGEIKTANAAAATTPGDVVKKLEIFDAAGGSLGFVAIYDGIA